MRIAPVALLIGSAVATAVAAPPAPALHGRVTYKGAKLAKTTVSMEAEAACAALHGGKPVDDEQVVIDRNGGVANAFVYVKSGLEGKKFAPPKQPVVLDQHGCLFTPRVVGLQAGGSLAVRNSDRLEHNVHPGPKNNFEWNEGMSPGGPDVIHKFARQEVMIRVKCNLHPWMRAWVGVVENPYFAVTRADGSFEIKDLPPGTYTIGVWHEKLGELSHAATITPAASATLDFTYTQK